MNLYRVQDYDVMILATALHMEDAESQAKTTEKISAHVADSRLHLILSLHLGSANNSYPNNVLPTIVEC